MAFGPENILFVADLSNAAIYALGTGDEARGDRNAPLNVEKINVRIAEMIAMMVARCRPRNLLYTTGHTVGVIAPPQNPCIAR